MEALDNKVRHVVQTILAQVVDVNNHIRSVQDKKELDEKDKVASTNFAHYHLMVLSILLNDFKDFAYDKFPDAKGIIDWAISHYEFGLNNNSFKPCECQECKPQVKDA